MIFTLYHKDFLHKRKIDNFDPYNLLLGFFYQYICATYDWFCATGSHITDFSNLLYQLIIGFHVQVHLRKLEYGEKVHFFL